MNPEQIIEEAGADFDRWREENDPLHDLPIEIASARYCRDRLADMAVKTKPE